VPLILSNTFMIQSLHTKIAYFNGINSICSSNLEQLIGYSTESITEAAVTFNKAFPSTIITQTYNFQR